jgi:hypothetical protein
MRHFANPECQKGEERPERKKKREEIWLDYPVREKASQSWSWRDSRADLLPDALARKKRRG